MGQLDALFLGWGVSLLAVQLRLVGGQQVGTDDGHQIAVLTQALIDQLLGVMHCSVEVRVVAVDADDDLAGHLAFG
ncbi:hypothetical protein D9M71_762590 [compost metagenome]